MADVQWIRLIVGMFDGNSFKKIKRAKIGGVSYRDKLTAIWFELLDLAGKSNANGYLIDNNEIPYRSFEDIATMLDRDEKEIELCMQYYLSERMIEIIDDVYCLTNFLKYQNQDGLEKIREQNRLRQSKYREKQRLLKGNIPDNATDNVIRNVTVTQSNAIEEEEEEDQEKEIHSFSLSGEDRERLKLKYIGGDLGKGVVMLSDEQFDTLLDMLSWDEFHKYVGIVAECELNGKRYKNKSHFQAILDMVEEDRKCLNT
jgi:predicted phage replisome organizer